MGETRVDLLHLLEDLADAYPGEPEETVLTEIVANALDSGAATIAVRIDAAVPMLTIVDDGSGMRRAELRKFHDVASSTKQRGQGIGFAGVGIKLGLLLSEEVLTETRRGKEHVATRWTLTTRRRAPWRWVPPEGRVGEHGTAVSLRLSNALSKLLDPGWVEATLRRHFEPLFDPRFTDALRRTYEHGMRFEIDGRPLPMHHQPAPLEAALELRLPRKRIPSAFGYLARFDESLPEERRGIAVSTYGKVIKRGWEWLGVSPSAADRVSGVIEAPALAAALTLNKADFIRSGPRGAIWLSYRKAIQEVVMTLLATWGEGPDEERARRRVSRPIERDLRTVLAELAEQFPLLAMLVERRPGGGRRMPVSTGNGASPAGALDLFAPPAEPSSAEAEQPAPTEAPVERGEDVHRESERAPESATPPPVEIPAPEAPKARRSRQPVRLGLAIQFETRPDAQELARLVETTVWVNDAHPAYRRAVASRSEGYHLALAVALALAEVAVTPAEQRAFVSEFLARWGESADERRGSRRRGSGRKRGTRTRGR